MIDASTLTVLFDALPDVVFFIKDREGHYRHANRTLLTRLGLHDVADVVGKTAAELFPSPLGERYLSQDRDVVQSGREIRDELEWHLFPNFAHGWCLTQKLPLVEHGKVIGLAGISRDLPGGGAGALGRLQTALTFAERHLDEPLTIAGLAERAGMSIAQFERHTQRLFELTPRQWLLSRRIERALPLIESGETVARIAQACGFSDHSAFTRAFRRHVGVAPRDYAKVAQPKNR
jgi:AraC-like DNA-binding protein